MDRYRDNPFPFARRDAAARRHIRPPHGLSLVAELGGLRLTPRRGARPVEAFRTTSDLRTERASMNVTATSPETGELHAVRQLLAEEIERDERLVLMLFYAESLSFADIAEVLDLPLPAVERLYRETMAMIRERLA